MARGSRKARTVGSALFAALVGGAGIGFVLDRVVRPDAHGHLSIQGPAARRTVDAARDEVRRGVVYDPEYRVIGYPGGDVPRDRGACTDVVVRSLRAAGFDLQKLMHEDMRRNFRLYPQRYGLRWPDPNIDHRRVPNQRLYFARFGRELSTETVGSASSKWQPGDIVYWKLTGGVLDHCGIVTDEVGASGLPKVVHNLSRTVEEDCLTRWRITGHVRFPAKDRQSTSR